MDFPFHIAKTRAARARTAVDSGLARFFHSSGEKSLATESLNRTAGLRFSYSAASN